MLLNRCVKSVMLVCVISAASTVSHGQAPTYAERLGWPVGTKAVIFHVDDAGMSHNSNMGAIKATEDGVATSLSVMMMIIVHCTVQTQEFSLISGSGPAREAELRLVTDPDVKAFIKSEGIVLTTWRELKQRRQRVKD